mgnify:CR=1 FL=1
MALERLDYPTQKPEALLERIILLGSNEDDLVFDCFMGVRYDASSGNEVRPSVYWCRY